MLEKLTPRASGEKLTDRVLGALPWLDSAADVTQKIFSPVLGPQGPKPLQDFLNGTWLGHPLHPVIVSVPIGAWTTTMLLDLAGMEEGADLSLQLGVLAAVGAAATGAAQWQDTDSKARKTGILHALLNTGALALYIASWVSRSREARNTGIMLSSLGYATAGIAAWLGGEVAYDMGIGVNHTAFEAPVSDWEEVLDQSELEENTPKRVQASGGPVMLLRQGYEIFAISPTCTHLGGPLDEGQLDGSTISCPWHGSVFCVSDGKVLHGPATMNQPAFDVRVQNGQIAVRTRTK